mmetsp:Transcript_92281/g.238929  ORF Transcript_92281/g.238929 Transcript_92281/m.238929 type:complete len:268 (-) Transcript_92281:653-1456(-)
MIFSVELISSSVICPESAALLIILAFSTSSSAVVSFSISSCSDFLAWTRALNSFWKDLKGLSFFCASVNFCCIEENSVRAVLRVSGANFLAPCSLRLISDLASLILFCASAAAVSISSNAFFRRSASSSGGSATSGAAIMPTASTESSAAETISLAGGKDSSNSLACSASFFASAAPAWSLVKRLFTRVASAAKPVWRTLNFGDSLESSVTEGVADTPPFLASVMSCVKDFCAAAKAVCCFCKFWCASLKASSPLAAVSGFEALSAS